MAEKNDASAAQPREAVQEIFEEIFSALPPRLRENIKRHLREILSAVIIVILGSALWYGYAAYTTSQENKAAAALGFALHETEPAKRAAALQQVVEHYGNTHGGKHAVLLLAEAQREAGNLDDAERNFRKALDGYPAGSVLHAGALMGLGYIEEQKAALEEAAAAYSKAGSSDKIFRRLAVLDLARVSAASGDQAGALEAYNKYISQEPQAAGLDFVRYQVLRLSKGGD